MLPTLRGSASSSSGMAALRVAGRGGRRPLARRVAEQGQGGGSATTSFRLHRGNYSDRSQPARMMGTGSRRVSSSSGSGSNGNAFKKPQAPKAPPTGGEEHGRLEHLGEMYTEMESKLMARMRTADRVRFRGVVLGSSLVVIWVGVVFGGQIRRFVGGQTAEVARETLKHESLQVQTQELATAVVHTLLNDKEVLAAATAFLRSAAMNTETQASLVNLTNHVLQHPETLREVARLGKDVVAALVVDPDVLQNMVTLALKILQDARTQQQAAQLLVYLSQEPEVYEALVGLTSRVLNDDRVRSQIVAVMTDSSHTVMNDSTVMKHSKDFVAEVMGDEQVQRSGGDALWYSVQFALQTRLMKAVGFGLVCASVIIAGRSYGGGGS
jgi:predicted nucleic-acid-binding protein